jgi:hypothetical protein
MDLEEINLHNGFAFLGEPAQVTQAEGAAVQRDPGGSFDAIAGMVPGQLQQPLQDAQLVGTTVVQHRLSPGAGVGPEQPAALQ